MIEPETIIDGRYRVISRLGSGGMADVYLATDQLLGREVAVKVLHHHFAEDQEFVERFRREASSAAALSHPNIVGIFDRGEWNETYYIAMEYVSGRSLKAIVREQGPLDPATSIDIVVQILLAAQFAHRRGVIHRDLKPHNVMLDEEGRVRVTDFGIARAGASDMTLTGSIMGTAQYLSPEQAQGYAVSDASDLYSVGVILYELLTGVVPFEGETAVAIAFKQVAAMPRPPSELNPSLPASLDAVVLRALAKDPTARYADAGELINALQLERAALPAHSQAPAPGAPRGPRAMAAAPPAAPPPSTGSMLLLPPDRAGGGTDRSSGEGERSKRRALWWALGVLLLAGIAALVIVLVQSEKKVLVPSVTGLTEQAAATRLSHSGLDPAPTLLPSSTVDTGLVISQDPSAGTKIEKGSHVTIVVSAGPATAALINVAGLSAKQALERLRKAEFKPTLKPQASTSIPAGTVIATDPSAGTEVQVGSSVTVLVSSGPKAVRVPDVTGETQEAAEATLTNDELVVGTVTQRISEKKAPETVLSQTPTTGNSVRAGAKVNLVVAKAPEEVAVPEVVGQTEAVALGALRKAGFKTKVLKESTAVEEQAEKVLRQTPTGQTEARKGATVTVYLGVFATQTGTTTTTTTTTTPPPAGE